MKMTMSKTRKRMTMRRMLSMRITFSRTAQKVQRLKRSYQPRKRRNPLLKL